jgi:tRNA(Arg) A34 adenosine deaminase TadA
MQNKADQEKFMRRAVELARIAMTSGKGRPFGAVIVRDNEVVAEGHNEVLLRTDITAHAEIVVLQRATKALKSLDLSDCDIFVNGVPCPMCMTAIYRAQIRKLYYACTEEDAAAIGFEDEPVYAEFVKPMHERALPVEQVVAVYDEALACYQEWHTDHRS